VRTDRFQLVFPQAEQLLLIDPALVQEPPQNMRKSRTAKVIFAINLLTALGQVKFQVPQIRRLFITIAASCGVRSAGAWKEACTLSAPSKVRTSACCHTAPFVVEQVGADLFFDSLPSASCRIRARGIQ